jgi:predicted DNA-binding transcriptional regulator AlpA
MTLDRIALPHGAHCGVVSQMGKAAEQPVAEKLAYSVTEFCHLHGLSRSLFYALQRTGDGPAVMRLGGRVAVSKEAAARWRAAREAA